MSFSVFDLNVLSSSVNLLDVGGEDSSFGVVHFGDLAGVNFWSLDDLDLSDLNVLNGVDVRDFFADFLLNDFRGE